MSEENPVMGRPPKFTTKVRNRLIEAFEKRAPILTACEFAGIHRDTYYRWQNYAEACKKNNEQNEYTDFYDILHKIKSERTFSLIEQIIEGKRWQGAAWYLERVQSDRFNANGELLTQLMDKLKLIEDKLGKK